jgi:hypothetical protein
MKVLLFLITSLLLNLAVYAQQTPKTQQEMEAFLKNIQKKSDSMQNVLKNKKTIGNPNTTTNGTIKPGNSKKDNGPENQKLPAWDSVRVRSLPKKIFTPAELNAYLTTLYDQLCRKFRADAVNSAKSIAAKLNNNPAKLEAAALHAWQNGADEEAVLLITKGATVSNDGLLLTNTGGMLDIYGLPEKAIPVLRTVVSYAPQNAIAHNNLGQAFTALGMLDSAMYYFSRCLSLSSQHPEANNTAGHIELKKGNKSAAQVYFENSIRGSFNLSAYTGLATIFKDDKSKLKIAHLIKPKVKKPEHFNRFKYSKLPRQCYNVNEAATVSEEFKAYKEMLSRESRKFDLLRKEAENQMGKTRAEDFNKKTMEAVMEGKSYMKPFQVLGSAMEAEATLGYHDDMADLEKFNKENREQYKQLEAEYKNAYEQLMKSGGDCPGQNELKNKYLERFAQINTEWQSRNMLIENKYIDDFLYWCYFSAFDIKDYRHRLYTYVKKYIYRVNMLAQVKILEPCKETEPEEVEQPQPGELQEFDCPVSVQIAFAVGKLKVDCEKLSFKAGELIIFKYEKQFTGKRQSTISIGGGVSLDLKEEIGTVKAGFETGMDMTMYFTFDKAGNCTDAGMAYKAYAGVGADFSAGERIKIDRNLGDIKEEIGWRFGINSGVEFTTPSFMKDKPQVPVNPNVRIN